MRMNQLENYGEQLARRICFHTRIVRAEENSAQPEVMEYHSHLHQL